MKRYRPERLTVRLPLLAMNRASALTRLRSYPALRIARNNRGHEPVAVHVTECSHPKEYFEPRLATADYISGDRFLVGFCHRCKLHVTAPVPEDVEKYYPSSYYGSGKRFNPLVEWLLNNLYAYRARHIEGKQRPGKVLDIGCGRGLLLNKLRERGWEPRGTELS